MKKWLVILLAGVLLPVLALAQVKSRIEVHFPVGKSYLTQSQKAKLHACFDTINPDLIQTIVITGYADDVGSDQYNETLSLKRARTVKRFLSGDGFPPGLIRKVIGKGEIALVRRGHGYIKTQRAANRKVVVRVVLHRPDSATVPVLAAQPSVPAKEVVLLKSNLFSDTLKVGQKLTLSSILFEGGRCVLLPESYATLEQLAKSLTDRPEIRIRICGHVCCLESPGDGLDLDTGLRNLSEARARAIYQYLLKNGIDGSRLSYVGFGGNYKTGKGEKFDRRVEIEIVEISGN